MEGVQPTALYMEESTAHPSRCDPENRETRPDRSRRLGGGESSQNLNRPYIHIEESTRPNTRAVLHRPPERKPEPHGYHIRVDPRRVEGGEREKRHQTNHKPRHQTLFIQRATNRPAADPHIMKSKPSKQPTGRKAPTPRRQTKRLYNVGNRSEPLQISTTTRCCVSPKMEGRKGNNLFTNKVADPLKFQCLRRFFYFFELFPKCTFSE